MGDDDPWVRPWTVLVTLASGAFALLAYPLSLPYGQYAAVVAAVGATYVLYRWGKHRERRSKYSDDPKKRRREMEQEGRIGGNGGNP